MESTFNQAADPCERLRLAIEKRIKIQPDLSIRDVPSALQHLAAVYVTEIATRDQAFGTDIPTGRYHVGVCCGNGKDSFLIDVGFSRDHGERIARDLGGRNRDLGILAEKAPQPFIAVNPFRIKDVFSDRGNIILRIKDSRFAFSLVYADDHRADIDAFLLNNKLIQARSGNAPLEPLQAPRSADGKVVELPFRSAKPAFKP